MNTDDPHFLMMNRQINTNIDTVFTERNRHCERQPYGPRDTDSEQCSIGDRQRHTYYIMAI